MQAMFPSRIQNSQLKQDGYSTCSSTKSLQAAWPLSSGEKQFEYWRSCVRAFHYKAGPSRLGYKI
jgi:hypothetical protein